jgi:hypothetical protein
MLPGLCQSIRRVETKGLGGLEVDDELEAGRLHDWQVGGFGAFENPPGITPI